MDCEYDKSLGTLKMSNSQLFESRTNENQIIANNAELKLSILVTVVSGKKSVARCLHEICMQADFEIMEVIVPYDDWSLDIADLSSEFPEVIFHFIDDLGLAASKNVSSFQHRLYDRRRAMGLRIAKGEIIAMIEDHAIPAEDWCDTIIALHKQPIDVIGGAIENKIDRPLNWAWYYCDFGRYGRPLKETESHYLSDINISYKRGALMSVRDEWNEAYHETTVNWALTRMGKKLRLDERLLVYQERPGMTIIQAFGERISWGRVFAETRAKELGVFKRFLYCAGSLILPVVLLSRVAGHMRRQNQPISKIATFMPYTVWLLIGWSVGEAVGYFEGEPVAAIGADSQTQPKENGSIKT